MSAADLAGLLRAELARRRQVNPRYSVRAFAAYLDVDHSTLSQILRGRRAAPVAAASRWATLLGLGPEQAAFHAAAGTADANDLAARNARSHWLGEAHALLSEPAHWQLLELLRAPDWRPDTRWAAARLGTGVDRVNDAMTRLLRLGLLSIDRDGAWRDTSGLAEVSPHDLKERALARMRIGSVG